jgi:hypothetical protein
MPPTGPVSIVDADTGASIVEIGSPGGYVYGASFSPNGEYLALITAVDPYSGVNDLVVYDTSDGHQVRTISSLAGGPTAWSPDSSEITGPTVSGSQVPVFSATDPSGASDRTVQMPSGSCDSAQAVDWSTAGRLLVFCHLHSFPGTSSIVTASASDGSDARVVATDDALHLVLPLGFSPSGQYVKVGEFLLDPVSHTPQSARVGYASDVASSPITYLTEPLAYTPGFGLFAGSWR